MTVAPTSASHAARHRVSRGASREAVLDAVLAGLAEHGTREVTVGQVAARAGVSRASLYRWYPGGRTDLLLSAAEHAVDGHLTAIDDALDRCDDLEDLLATVVSESVRQLRDDELLAQVLEREPEVVLPLLAFDRVTVAFDIGERILAPHLARIRPDLAVRPVAEWITRLVLSHVVHPSPTLDLADPAVARAHVTTHVLPGLFDLT